MAQNSEQKPLAGSAIRFVQDTRALSHMVVRPAFAEFAGSAVVNAGGTGYTSVTQPSVWNNNTDYKFRALYLRAFWTPYQAGYTFQMGHEASMLYNIRTVGSTTDWFDDPIPFMYTCLNQRLYDMNFGVGYIVEPGGDLKVTYTANTAVDSNLVPSLTIFLRLMLIGEHVLKS